MMSKKKKRILLNIYFLLTSVAVLLLDQVSKYFISIKVTEGTTMAVIPEIPVFY